MICNNQLEIIIDSRLISNKVKINILTDNSKFDVHISIKDFPPLPNVGDVISWDISPDAVDPCNCRSRYQGKVINKIYTYHRGQIKGNSFECEYIVIDIYVEKAVVVYL